MRAIRTTMICLATCVTLFWALITTVAQAQQTYLPRFYWTMPNDVPLPTVVLPEISTMQPSSGTASLSEGYLFLSPHEKRVGRSPYDPTLLILDNTGDVIYYRQIDDAPDHTRFDDFKVLENGQLVSWVGALRRHQFQDSSYNIVGSVKPVGRNSDLHDIVLLPNGNHLLMIYSGRTVDVSDLVDGGATDLGYVDCDLQEIDSNGEALFEWRSSEHFALTDTYNSLLAAYIDGPHCNSIELDTDGHLLLSSRDHYEVTKINLQTGEIIWRLGGKNNQFEFVNAIGADDVMFEKQHDARRVDNGNLTLFDNRNGKYSRAIEYALDEEAMTATLVWEHRATPDRHGAILGNAQRLPNGNTLISWGSAPKTLSEVTRDGTTLLELSLPPEMVTYRSYRYPWVGKPTTPPTLVLIREIIARSSTSGPDSSLSMASISTSTISIQLAYSWNGDTEAKGYHIYGDASAFPETLLGTQKRTGFETTTVLTESDVISDALQLNYNFRVVPIDADGQPFTRTSTLAGSNLISSPVRNIGSAILITATVTVTPQPLPTNTPLPSPTPALASTNTPQPTSSPVPSPTPTSSHTPSPSPSPTPLPTATETPQPTLTVESQEGDTHKLFIPSVIKQR